MTDRNLEAPRRRDAGFTLVELLVVVIIIGILAAIAIPLYLDQQKRAADARVTSDVYNAGTVVAGIDRPLTEIFPANKQSLYVDAASGLAGSSVVMWNDQPGAPAILASDKNLVEVVHVRTVGAIWNRVHEPSEFCIVGRSKDSGKFNYPGGDPLLYRNQAYYDSMLGGVVSFETLVRDYTTEKRASCYGYVKRFLETGGSL